MECKDFEPSIIQDNKNEYININKVAEAKGLKSNRSLRLEINKPESKYIAREVKVNGGTSYEILYSSLEPEIQQKLREGNTKSTALVPLNYQPTTFVSESARLTSLARLDIVKALLNYRKKFTTKKEADSMFLDLYNSGMYLPKVFKFIGTISIGTLHRWVKSYERYENYLFKCLLSLIRQTLKEIEIICVNDGSTDNSENIIKMFAKEDSRIKLINQENKKQGAARNTGMQVATGEYIGFVDSDDYVDLNYFERLYRTAINYDSDIALATNVRIGKNKFKLRLNLQTVDKYTELQDKLDVCQQWKNECPTNKIYRKSYLDANNIQWPEGIYCEDKLFTIKAVYFANAVVTVPDVYYYYFDNPKSTVNTYSRRHKKQFNIDKNNARRDVIYFLREVNANIRNNNFWYVSKGWKIPIWQKKEGINIKKLLVLNLPIFVYEELSNSKIQSFMFGLINTIKSVSETKEQKIIKLLGLTFLEKIIKNDICYTYLFKILINKYCLSEKFFKNSLRTIKYDYDDIYLLHSNSGELFLFFAYIAKSFFKKNRTKNPLFIATKKYHIEILKLYYPEAHYLYIDKLKFKHQSDTWFINGHKVYIIFSDKHFYNEDKNIKNNDIGKAHYLKSIIQTLNLTENDCQKIAPTITKDVEISTRKKIESLNLNLNKFIILAPEALSCSKLSNNFWKILSKSLQQQGYDIFVNTLDKHNYIDGCKGIYLTHRELFSLAQKAKAIISLKSGISEFLLPTNVPNIAIYTNFKNKILNKAYPVEKIISGYSMLNLPFVEKDLICEINNNLYKSDNELLNQVIISLETILRKKETLS